jgi:hypothetical protein
LPEGACDMQELSANQRSPARYSRLTGTVTDEDGEPLRGLCIKVMSGEMLVGWDDSDCNGHYVVEVPPGTYEVRFCSLAYHEVVDPKVVVEGEGANLDAVVVPFI